MIVWKEGGQADRHACAVCSINTCFALIHVGRLQPDIKSFCIVWIYFYLFDLVSRSEYSVKLDMLLLCARQEGSLPVLCIQ